MLAIALETMSAHVLVAIGLLMLSSWQRVESAIVASSFKAEDPLTTRL